MKLEKARKPLLIASVCVAVVLAGVAIVKIRSQSKKSPEDNSALRSGSGDDADVVFEKTGSNSLAPSTVTAAEPGQGRTVASKGSSTMARPFEYTQELTDYLHLHTNVFLTEADKAQKQALLHHAGLLRALGHSLMEPSRNMEMIHQQDAAIDLLIEALRNGDSKVASEVLQGVVQDSQIEDSSLERGAREQLAGLKAEVLYQWSSVNPDMAARLEGWLPGPVSQKIWANVLKMQQNNEDDSHALAEARANSH